jgi:peptidoglycan/xylan/chitin deacetylase (PgdA/CDA1 family)
MVVAASAAVLSACSGGGRGGGPPAAAPSTSTSASGRVSTTTTTTTAPADPAAVGANELGSVPVVMYHRLVPVVKGEYDRTPDEFRAELTQLHDAGFRPVTAREYVTGRLPVEAGRSPVVLTFDDSTRDQFALTADGGVDPASAVGILLDFAAAHPGFRPVATMYVNADPFGVADSGPVLRKLVELGFELGDHTATHANLSKLSTDAAERELVLGRRVITSAVPGAEVDTMALPFGVRPADRSILTRGSADGEDYAFRGVFLVGAGPSPSPFASTFDPAGLPRIRSSTWTGGDPNFGTGYWLDWFAKHPDRRFVSDGDPSAVSFPRALGGQLAPAFADVARPY